MKKKYEEKINKISETLGVQVRLVLNLNTARYNPIVSLSPTYVGLVYGYGSIRTKGEILTPQVVMFKQLKEMNKQEIENISIAFENVCKKTKEINALIKEFNDNL